MSLRGLILVWVFQEGQQNHRSQLCSFKCSLKLISHQVGFISWGFCDKSRSPMAQKADIYPFVVLEAESLKLRCKRGTLPPKSRSGSSLPLTASNDSKCSLAGSHLNQTSVSIIIGFRAHLKSVLNIHWKDWCWSWSLNTLATWCEEVTRWKRPWCWERLKAGGKGNDRGWDGWMASPT